MLQSESSKKHYMLFEWKPSRIPNYLCFTQHMHMLHTCQGQPGREDEIERAMEEKLVLSSDSAKFTLLRDLLDHRR